MKKVIVAHKSSVDPVKIDDSMTLWRMLDKASSPSLDFVWTSINGFHGRRTNKRSTKLYYVASGKLEIRSAESTAIITSGDVCIVPPGSWCEITGFNAEVGIVCAPAFDPVDEESK